MYVIKINKVGNKNTTEITDVCELSPDVYYKFYVKDKDIIKKLSDTELCVLNAAIYNSKYPYKNLSTFFPQQPIGTKCKGNIFKLDILKKYISDKTNIDVDTFNNIFNSFIDKQFFELKENDANTYYLNTKYFMVGTVNEDTKSVKLTTVYKKNQSIVSEPYCRYEVHGEIQD